MPKRKNDLNKLGNFDTSKILSKNKSYMSLAYGVVTVVVIFVIIFLGVRAITQRPEVTDEASQTQVETTYIVAEGDNLWTIAENFYNDGFKWTVIAEANNLDSPDAIETGMELVIPEGTPSLAMESEDAVEETLEDSDSVPTSEPTIQPTVIQPTVVSDQSKGGVEVAQTITGNSYTVVKGDHLWSIAVRAYGDGFKWIEIAQANDLENPDIIHPGNVFTLPR